MGEEEESRQAEADASISWFGQFGERAIAESPRVLSSAIGDFTRDYGLARDHQLAIEPIGRRMFAVTIEPAAGPTLTARIPIGTARDRAALVGMGWANEPASSGTRYYTRRFTSGPSELSRAIDDAYRHIYGARAKNLRWALRVVPVAARRAVELPDRPPRWDLRLDDSLHTVEIRVHGLRMSVKVDQTEFRIFLPWGSSRRSAAFPVGAHQGTMTVWREYPPWRTRLRRALHGSVRGLPWYVVAVAVGAGAIAAAASSSLIIRSIFELTIDGRSYGAWVSTYESDTAGWSFELVPRNPWRTPDEPSP